MRTDGQTDRQTDMTKLILALRNSVNAPENYTKDKQSYKQHTEHFMN